MTRTRSRRGTGALALGLLFGALGCSRGEPVTTNASAGAASTASVPKPSDLVAELRVPSPARSYGKLRASLGEDAVLLPRSVGGLAVRLLGLPLRAAQEIDEGLPLVGALAGDSESRFAVALHVRDGGTFVVVLTSGEEAPFSAERRDGVVHLAPRGALREPLAKGLALGVAGNYLVIGDRADSVSHLGPFLARELGPRMSASASDGADLTLQGEGKRLGLLFERSGARFADRLAPETRAALAPLVDPATLASSLGGALAETSGFELAVTLGSGTHRIDATARLPSGTPAEARPPVDWATLGALPAGTIAAASFGETVASRLSEATARSTALAALLALRPKGPPFDREKLAAPLRAIAEGRGDTALVGAGCTGAGLTGFALGPVRDRKRLDSGVTGLLALFDEPALKGLLDETKLVVSVSKGRLERVSEDVTLLRVAPRTEGEGARATDMRFTLGDTRYAIAAGAETVELLQALHREAPTSTLEDAARFSDLRSELGEGPFAAFYLDPVAAHACVATAPSATPSRGIVGAVSRTPEALTLRIRVAHEALGIVGRLLR